MTGLRVLITNNTLGPRAGTELYVRDIAMALIERGHVPIAYSRELGEVAQELRAATVAVIDDLGALATPPDIIHGHHHLETMTALLNFPGVPAIYFCHGWLPWEEAAPRFPRILRYVAVDDTCRDRLVCEHGIAEDQVKVLLNFVDTKRFKPRGPLPRFPRRGLVFSNNANENTYLKAVREACERAGISLDVIGRGAGNPTTYPERTLLEYDLVFAKGRSALEALAVGAAVILCDASGAGPMVTLPDLDRLRSLNFGIRALRRPIDPETIGLEIARYDAGDAAEVSQRIRACAGQEKIIDEIISLYEAVIGESRKMPEHSQYEEERAASAYLFQLSPRLKGVDRLNAQHEEEVHELQARLAAQNEIVNQLRGKDVEVDRLNAQHEEEVHELQARLAAQNETVKQLRGKELELDRITQTFGWRLLVLYGPLKYRLLLPTWNHIKKLFRTG